MKPASDEFDVVVGFELKRDDRPVDPDDSGFTHDRESFGDGREMFDLDEGAYTPFMRLKARRNGGPRRIFKMGDEPGSREHRGHDVVREDDAVGRSDHDPFLSRHPDPRNRLHGERLSCLAWYGSAISFLTASPLVTIIINNQRGRVYADRIL